VATVSQYRASRSRNGTLTIKRLRVTKSREGVLTVKVNRYVETIDPRELNRGEMFERLRWACVTGGVEVENETIYEIMRANGLMA
jgi:hypothetical protein